MKKTLQPLTPASTPSSRPPLDDITNLRGIALTSLLFAFSKPVSTKSPNWRQSYLVRNCLHGSSHVGSLESSGTKCTWQLVGRVSPSAHPTTVWAPRTRKPNPPENSEAIEWLLLTCVPVENGLEPAASRTV